MNEVLTPTIDRLPTPGLDRRTAILTGLAGATAMAALVSSAQAQEVSPQLDEVRALLKAHDDALKSQDVKAVLATFAEKSAVIGTGPGEVWSGHEEIKAAYEQFFKVDKGEQEFEYHFRLGGLEAGAGWLVTSGNVKGKKDGKAFEFPINLSLAVVKAGGGWRIAALHFSTLTSEAGKGA